MIEPVEDITRKEGRETALEMWAAQIYADQSRQGRGASQESPVGTGGSTVRKDIQVKQAQQVKEVAKTEETATVDTQDTVSPSVEVPEFKRLDLALARLQTTRVQTPAETPQPVVTKNEPVLERASVESRPEQPPTAQETASVSVSSFKPMSKNEATRESSATTETSDPEEEQAPGKTPRIVPGNSPKARAYVPAAKLMGNSPQREFYQDFLVAL